MQSHSEPGSDAQPNSLQALQGVITRREATVVVMGLGAVGLALVQVLLEAGYRVLGVDSNADTVHTIRAGRSPMRHIPEAWCAAMAGHPRLGLQCVQPGQAIACEDELGQPNCIGVLCVPTPLCADGEPDLEPLRAAGHSLAQSLSKPALELLESTTFPGTTRGIMAPIFADSGFVWDDPGKPDHNLFLAFAPERVNPGSGDPAARQTPRLVGGLQPEGTELAERFYASLGFAVQTTERAEIAEAAKLVENVYRAVNIALVNELKLSFAAQGIDIWQVLDAAASKGFGFQRFDPGPGTGGSCIPVDPRYLAYFARQGGVPVRLVELAGTIDRGMAGEVIAALEFSLAEKGQALAGSRVLLLGMAYKPEVNILSESPSLRIAARLHGLGAEVLYSDPHVPGPIEIDGLGSLASETLTRELLQGVQACLYLTDHAAFPLETIAAHAPLIVDTRGNGVLRGAGERYRSA